MRVVTTAIILGLAAVGTSAQAQGLPMVETSTIDLGPYVQPGAPVRISGTALRRVGGYVVGVRSDTILLSAQRGGAADASRPIRLGAVDTLWTRGDVFWPTLGLGFSAGLATGGAICVFSLSENCRALPIATVAGSALGAIIGKARKVWRKRFERRDGGPVPTIGPWR